MDVFIIRSSTAGLAGRDAMLARRLLDTLALCGVGAASGYSVIMLGGRRPASYASSWNSDSSGNVSLNHPIWHLCTLASKGKRCCAPLERRRVLISLTLAIEPVGG